MTEQLFTDQDAAQLIESVQPRLAGNLQRLIAAGQTPHEIMSFIRARNPVMGTVSIPMVEQAVQHYAQQKEQDDG